MQVYLKYSFTDENKALWKQVNEFFLSLGMESEISKDRVFAEKEYKSWWEDEPVEDYFLRQAIIDCIKLYEKLKRNFVLTGVIDTSFTAGELADFAVTCKEGHLTAQLSDWYIEECMDNYETFEYFQECFPDATEEEYEKLKENKFFYTFQDETGDYTVISETVPLHDAKID